MSKRLLAKIVTGKLELKQVRLSPPCSSIITAPSVTHDILFELILEDGVDLEKELSFAGMITIDILIYKNDDESCKHWDDLGAVSFPYLIDAQAPCPYCGEIRSLHYVTDYTGICKKCHVEFKLCSDGWHMGKQVPYIEVQEVGNNENFF